MPNGVALGADGIEIPPQFVRAAIAAVGELRAPYAPPSKHWWHITRHVDAGGSTTSPFLIAGQYLALTLDLTSNALVIDSSGSWRTTHPLIEQGSLGFYPEDGGEIGLLEGAGAEYLALHLADERVRVPAVPGAAQQAVLDGALARGAPRCRKALSSAPYRSF
jgi:hypothetical protein